MARRANGEGSFYYDESKGLYRAMIVTPTGKRLTKAHKNEEIVRDWLNEQRLLVGRGMHVEPSSITLLQWLYQWVEIHSKPNVRDRSYERNLSLIPHVEPIGDISLQKVTPTHIQSLYNDMEEDGFSGETRRKVHILLNSAYKQAVLNRFVLVNPVAAIKAPKATQDEVKVFTPMEIDKLLNTAREHRLYSAVLLTVTTGMRLGEILGVRWQDINFNEPCVNVRQNLQMTRQGIIFEPPKTEKGKRKIPLPEKTVKALEEYRKAWVESRLTHPAKEDDPNIKHTKDLVFVTRDHMPISPQNFLRRIWAPLIMRTEFAINGPIPNPMSIKQKLEVMLEKSRQHPDWKCISAENFHALRHTYATTLLASGVPIVDVSRVLGHAKVSTTLDIYAHALPQNQAIIADKIANALLK